MIHLATNKARFIITVEEDMAKEIQDYHYENRYKDRTKAILALLRMGLDYARAEQTSDSKKVWEDIDEVDALPDEAEAFAEHRET
jgi:hypothetical protein